MTDSASSSDVVTAPPSSRVAWLGLTARQSLVWADEQILPESRYHHWVLLVRIDGTLDLVRFRRAWSETARSHDALGLIVDRRSPRQRFDADLPELREITLPHGVTLEQWAGEQSCREFDRSRPLWEATLVTSATHETAFALRAHYLVCDETSFGILATEVSERYLGLPVSPKDRFRDLLIRKGSDAMRELAEADTRAWQELLREPPPAAALLGCTRSASNPAATRRSLDLSSDNTRALRRQGTAAATSLESTGGRTADERGLDIALTTVILGWLQRLSGQRELVIAVPVDSRQGTSTRTAGLLSEPLYLRIEFDDAETFQSLSAKVQNAYDFAWSHGAAALGSSEAVTAYVASMPHWPIEFCGLRARFELGNAPLWSKVGLGAGDARDTLTIRYAATNQGGEVFFDFNDDTYPTATQHRLVGYFSRFLDAFLIDSTQGIRHVEVLAPDEIESLRELGQGRQPPEAPDLLAAFAKNVEDYPSKVAVEFGERALSYVELDRVTNRLARRLKAAGVKPESRVAVAMPRGFGELAALLATLKAGGAYVPVDPSHPVERVRVILEDAEPQAVIAPKSSPLRSALPPGVSWLELDDPLEEGADVDDGPLGVSLDPGQLAYILFTSGSTGRPKGVEIGRAAFANFLQSMAAEPGLRADDRVIAITTTTFDIAGLELFLPLYVGGTVVIADRDTAGDPVRLRAMFEQSRISLMQATPATWRLLLDAGWRGHDALRMLCGGEAMSQALAQRLVACGAELWNVYGPTETTVWSTLELIRPGVEKITIGHPIDHTTIDLRDTDGHLVPLGTIGEICIGGRGLARGYRGRPDLTAERFPTDPQTHERYYRTGDLGRYLSDGRLECLGRVDHQVKVRGFRIEPADIEAQLRSVQDVKEVLVVARPSGEGDPILVAYWVGAATRDALHRCAKEKLPHYMVPSAYVHLEVFPLTTSGKIDRKQLPAPELQPSEEDAGTAPRNDQESIVAAIWREILGLAFVPIDRDFFSLGGTSVRAIQMRSRIVDAFGVNLPLRALFEHPTVEAIVSQLGQPESDDAPVVTRLAHGRDPIPWIGLMGIQLYEDIAQALPKDQALIAMHVPVRYVPGVEAFPTVTTLAQKYLPVIRQHQPKGPYYLLGLCHGGVVAFEVAAQLEAAGETVALVGLLDAELPAARRQLTVQRLMHAGRNLVADPRAAAKRVAERVAIQLPTLGARFGLSAAARAPVPSTPEPIDMPFDGPEIDADLAAYQQLGRHIRGTALTFRATRSDLAPWVKVDADLGWSGRAGRVVSHDIAASHLGIVRKPHAEEVARLLVAARQSGDAAGPP